MVPSSTQVHKHRILVHGEFGGANCILPQESFGARQGRSPEVAREHPIRVEDVELPIEIKLHLGDAGIDKGLAVPSSREEGGNEEPEDANETLALDLDGVRQERLCCSIEGDRGVVDDVVVHIPRWRREIDRVVRSEDLGKGQLDANLGEVGGRESPVVAKQLEGSTTDQWDALFRKGVGEGDVSCDAVFVARSGTVLVDLRGLDALLHEFAPLFRRSPQIATDRHRSKAKDTRDSWWARMRRRVGHLSETVRNKLWDSRGDQEMWRGMREEYIEMRENPKEGEQEDPLVVTARDKLHRLFPATADHTEDFPLTNAPDHGIEIRVRSKKGGWSQSQKLFTKEGAIRANVKNLWGFNLATSPAELVEENDAQIQANVTTNRADNIALSEPHISEADEAVISERVEQRVEENEALEQENATIEEHMTLKERVKRIFKKYGVMVLGVALAAGAVIGAIVEVLTKQLAAVARGYGNELKTIGKKLGQLLPGAIAAIASFLFRTAGETIGFLAKNAWLLIVAGVVWLVERTKKAR
ncbi:hypothetical protein QZH41_000494 [Actinostola sp. cb2023]|nr:hypothetical protein QZH41_000494 [Actinostola sp. cb2023]